MYFTENLLSFQEQRQGGISTVWLLATVGRSSYKKLVKKEIASLSIPAVCETITSKFEPLALRVSSNLLYGVSLAYKKKTDYFYLETAATKNRLQGNILYRKPGLKCISANVLPISQLFGAPDGPKSRKLAQKVLYEDDVKFDINKGLLPSVEDVYEDFAVGNPQEQRKSLIRQTDLSDYNVSLVVSPIHSLSDGNNIVVSNFQHGPVFPSPGYNNASANPMDIQMADLLDDVTFEFNNDGNLLFSEPQVPLNVNPNIENSHFQQDLFDINQSVPIEESSHVIQLAKAPERKREKSPLKFLDIDQIVELPVAEYFNRPVSDHSETSQIKIRNGILRYKGGLDSISVSGKLKNSNDIVKQIGQDLVFTNLLTKMLNQDIPSSHNKRRNKIRISGIDNFSTDDEIEIGRHRRSTSSMSYSPAIGSFHTPEIGRNVDANVPLEDFGFDLSFGFDDNNNLKNALFETPSKKRKLSLVDFDLRESLFGPGNQPITKESLQSLAKRRRHGRSDVRFSNQSRSSSMSSQRSKSGTFQNYRFSNLQNLPLYELSHDNPLETTRHHDMSHNFDLLNDQVKRFFSYLYTIIENRKGRVYSENEVPDHLKLKYNQRVEFGPNLVNITFEDIAPSAAKEIGVADKPEVCSKSIAAVSFSSILHLATTSLVDISTLQNSKYTLSKPQDIDIYFNCF